MTGHLQPGQRQFGFFPGALNGARDPSAAARHGVTRELDVDLPGLVGELDDPATPPSTPSIRGLVPRVSKAFWTPPWADSRAN